MPGLTLVAARRSDRLSTSEILPRLRALEHFPDYATSILVESPRLLVACTRYPEYPLTVVARGRWTALVEGRVYAPADGADRLLDLAPALFDGRDDTAELERWLVGTDGDFLAVLVDATTGSALVLGDRYGRLPVYWHADAERVTISRELSFLAARRSPDRLAMAQYLVFGHPLGTATLLAGVERLPPATLLELPHATTRQLVRPDYDARTPPVRSRDVAGRLGDALVEACRHRVEPGRTTMVALSGGIDSRLVAGALARCDAHAIGMTHLDDHGSEASDAATAGAVAARLGMPWELVRMRPPTGGELATLLKLKFGANYLGMSRVLPFLDRAVARHGRSLTCFTGDQGDRVLGPIAPLAPLPDDAAVARYVLRREAILSPEAVGPAIGIRPSDVLDSLVARIRSYPERQPARKYVHFLFQERGLRWAFEGEDRNRCYFWSVTPFFAPDVFELAMCLPPVTKAFHRLRVGVLAAIAPELVRIPDATTRGRLTSPVFRLQHTVRTMARRTMLHALDGDTERRLFAFLRRVDGYDARSPAVRLVREQLATGPAGAFFRPEGMERILGGARSIAREQFSVMFTVTSLVDALEGNGAALAHFAGTTFI
jgi:asparagine synthase (glutamine-hydrolysing)